MKNSPERKRRNIDPYHQFLGYKMLGFKGVQVDFAQLGEIFLTSATLKFENDLYVISLNWFVIATDFKHICSKWESRNKHAPVDMVNIPLFTRLYMPGGAGFLPSTVSEITTHQVYHYCIGCKTET